ncbi:MAG: peptidylprolyl isomerase [Candidatus Berkelbacteria bacterium]|nr:peptidylprolyl isomerase [Candidatus Berkelbacteria bacterium]
MGKKQRERKIRKLEKISANREEIKLKAEFFDVGKFFRSAKFWIFTVCALALIIYPIAYAKYIPHGHYAILETSMGEIKLELRPDKAPKTVANFVDLAKSGFYKNMIWHRVVKGFVIQTGDPLGTGKGGAGRKIPDEISDLNFAAGTVGMANSGSGTDDSQFFITSADAQQDLNGKYTSFATVVSGMNIVSAISQVPVDSNDKPTSAVYLESVTIK